MSEFDEHAQDIIDDNFYAERIRQIRDDTYDEVTEAQIADGIFKLEQFQTSAATYTWNHKTQQYDREALAVPYVKDVEVDKPIQ